MADVFLIQGISLRIILPLKVFTLHEDGTSTESAFVPALGDTYKLALNGKRQYQYIPVLEEVNDEMCAVATLSGSEVYGSYGVEFVVGRADGTKLRYACECGITLRQYTGEVRGGDGAPLYVGGALLEAGAFIFAEGGSGEQSDWNETDADSLAYIKNKPTIPTVPTNVSAFNNDAGYLNNNFCPIIEDTRSSAVAAITGVAPFSTLVDGQRIILHVKYTMVNNSTLELTLSDGQTTTGAIGMWSSHANANKNTTFGTIYGDTYWEFIYNNTDTKWVMVGQRDTNTTYPTIAQSDINAGTVTYQKVVTPKIIHENCYIEEIAYTSSITELKANKMYNFGTVSSLTIPSLDATNDLVSNALNFYALRFIAGADDISITFPTGVIVDDEPTINTGDYVEIMINLYVENNTNHFYASIKVWQAQ